MEKYDVLIVGAATSGAYFARQMAEKGFSVKVIEKLSAEKTGTRYDVFHIAQKDFSLFGLPRVTKGSPEWAFEFTDGNTVSPYGNYPLHTVDNVVGLHMHEYTMLLDRWAQEAGAVFEYGSAFEDFLYENGKICGVKCGNEQGEKEIYARVVVDCSGADAPVRRKLPDNYGIDRFSLLDNDKFYVTLLYVKFKNPKDYITGSSGCPFYKSWVAPQPDPEGAIIGIGSCGSYEYGERVLKEYLECVPVAEHTVTHIERGTTPYCRSPYSFVADGFIVTGDAGCLTKPNNGEGVTSSMVQMHIASQVLAKALKEDGCVTKEKLWEINTLYNRRQGADFVSTRALLINAVKAQKSEFEYMFKYLSGELLQDPGNIPGFKVPAKVFLRAGGGLMKGIVTGKISRKTLSTLLNGISLGGKLKKHYLAFPETPSGFADWCAVADALWQRVGKME